MDVRTAKAKLDLAKREGWRYRNWAALMTVTNLFLVLGILFVLGNQKTILTNIVTGEDYWIGHRQASIEYLKAMASNFVSLAVNIHPKNVMRQHERFLQYVDPEVYGVMKTRMELEAGVVRKNAVSQTFFEQNVITSKKLPNVAVVVGIRKIFYGNKLVSTVQARYMIRFAIRNGRLFVAEYKELGKDDKPFS